MMRRGVGRVGRPSLVGTVARTAVVAGTATAVAGGVSKHQANKAQQSAEAQADEQQQQQAPMEAAAPPPEPAPEAAPAAPDPLAEIQRLGEMHQQGLLSDEEFSAAKAKLLGI